MKFDDLKRIGKIEYKGSKNKEKFCFKYYNPEEVIFGKKMKDHLKFALSYWHTLVAEGIDMFGDATMDKSFGQNDPLEKYKAKAEFCFKLMDILGIDYYCFHDVDIAPKGKDLKETFAFFDQMVDYLASLQKKYNKKLLWATANNFSAKKFMVGAATSPNADVYTIAAAKVKKTIDATIKLGGSGYVFWGGREGYETLLNTDMEKELDNLATFLKLARDYGRENGFKGDFLIEPKPMEPTKHQYDFDTATAIGFLRKHNLLADFKINIEANHATLAGHTFEHELRTAAIDNMLGSIDANEGDVLLGWDTDHFPKDVYGSTLAMYEILKAGGFKNGGINFDARTRRASNTVEDLVLAYIMGMDTYALGLRKAVALIEDGRLDEFVKERYDSYNHGIGKRISEKEVTLEELYEYALSIEDLEVESGRQEYLESIINQIMFS
ncbi:MAG TPA: xylose isomerase [Acholeplasmataceae bacterium]|nr:xylose isomerase [Acholeplasmataceae bacterium]